MPGKSTGRQNRTFGTQTGCEKAVVSAREKGIQVGTYPDLGEKAKVTMQQQQRDSFPQISTASQEVFLFIRANKEYLQRLKNAFVKDKRVIENFGGTIVGVAEDITRIEGNLYSGISPQCIFLIKFRNNDVCERWTQSSNIFKQKDFPSPAAELELFSVPLHYLPHEDGGAFQLTEMYGLQVPTQHFYENYVQHVPKLMDIRRIYHGEVATPNVCRLRNCMIRPDTYILLNCADSEKKLSDFYDCPEYRQYREFRQQAVAETNTCVFTIKPVTSR